MPKQALPQDSTPLSPWGYWQASMQTWVDFSQRTSDIMLAQIGAHTGKSRTMEPEADTLASDLLRTFSDMNLRHWQNTARLLESFPTWMDLPNTMTGSALVDWFDKFQRQAGGAMATSQAPSTSKAADLGTRPRTLDTPNGRADDLTRIKGIGPKLSKRLNDLGIYHFKQIAEWSIAEADWVDDYLAFRGRVAREAWVSQARKLSANGAATIH